MLAVPSAPLSNVSPAVVASVSTPLSTVSVTRSVASAPVPSLTVIALPPALENVRLTSSSVDCALGTVVSTTVSSGVVLVSVSASSHSVASSLNPTSLPSNSRVATADALPAPAPKVVALTFSVKTSNFCTSSRFEPTDSS